MLSFLGVNTSLCVLMLLFLFFGSMIHVLFEVNVYTSLLIYIFDSWPENCKIQ